MDSLIALKDFRERLPVYEKHIKAGKSFTIVKRSRPIFTVGPIDDTWETVIDFTKFKKGGIDIDDLLERL